MQPGQESAAAAIGLAYERAKEKFHLILLFRSAHEATTTSTK